MFKKIIEAFKNKEIRQRILFTLGILLIYKLGTTIAIPRVDLGGIDFSDKENFAYIMSLMGGGTLSQFSLFTLGVGPYITASIIVEILASEDMLPALATLKKQGEQGRKKLNNTTRYLSLLLCVVQGYGLLTTLGIGDTLDFVSKIYVVAVMTAGSVFLVWLGDQITEKGVGNGVSIIIFAGIVMSMPQQVQYAYQQFVGQVGIETLSGVIKFAIYLLAYLAIIAFVVFLEKSVRKIPVKYASNNQGASNDITYLPIKLNSSGVMPVIYASSLLNAVVMIGSFFTTSDTLTNLFTIGNEHNGFQWSTLMYAILIILFSYYQSNTQVNPKDTAESLANQNAYIPGIRQGRETEKHISKVLNRITFIGMIGLLFIALLPYLIPLIFPSISSSIAFGGTGLIIVVGVVTETTTQIISKLNSKQYRGFSY